MGRRLIGKDVGHDVVVQQLRDDLGGVPDQTDGEGLSLALRFQNEVESFFEVASHAVQITRLKTALDAGWIDLDAEESGAVHGGAQGLGAVHPTSAGIDDELAGK